MHIHWKRTGALVLLAGVTALLPAACANEDTSIFIRGCLAVPHDSCTVTASITANFTLEGEIDAAYAGRGTYECFALVENQMDPTGDPNTLQTETDGVQLYEAEVQVLNTSMQVIQYTTATGATATAQFSVPVSGYVDPATGGTQGLGISEVTLIDSATLNALGALTTQSGIEQEVVVSAVIKGVTIGGFQVHTNTFLYPVKITYGTTCFVPPGASCVGGSEVTTTADCLLGQDELSNCQLIAGAFPLCGYLECTVEPPAIGGIPCTSNTDCAKSTATPVCDTTAGLCGTASADSAHCPAHIPADKSCCGAM
jgi:hypothetical protein